jgi:hypothetical protein
MAHTCTGFSTDPGIKRHRSEPGKALESISPEGHRSLINIDLRCILCLVCESVRFIILIVPVDRYSLPKDPVILQQVLVDLTTQLDKTQRLLAQLLAAKSGARSEQLSADQLRLFAQELGAELPEVAREAEKDSPQDDDLPPGSGSGDQNQARPRGRRPLPAHLKRERMEYDLRDEEKHCACCHQDLRPIGEETSERYENIPAQMLVIPLISGRMSARSTLAPAR